MKHSFIKKSFSFIKKATNSQCLLASIQVVLSLGIITLVQGVRKLLRLSLKYLDIFYVYHRQKLLRLPKRLVNLGLLRVCITYHCNRDCSFCYAKGPRQEFKQHMTLDDFTFLTGWAKSQGWQTIRLMGGEPTMHPDFQSILNITKQHGLTISLSTNGLYNPELNCLFVDSLFTSISFGYPQDQISLEERQLFRQNFTQIVKKNIFLILSWVVYPDGKDWHQAIDLAKKYPSRVVLRFSMMLPGSQTGFKIKTLHHDFKKISKQILDIAWRARKNHVMFYFYRPLLPCMFSKSELNYLHSISPFLYYTRCPLNLGGDCTLVLTINPDLTYYPCTGLQHFKGIKITRQTTRKDINQSFKKFMTRLCAQPLMDSCKTCKFFDNYKRKLEDKSYNLADKNVCQGGCLCYRV